MKTGIDTTTDVPVIDQLHNRLALLSKDPNNRALRADCVNIAMSQRKYDVALRIADEAINSDPNDAQARFERASALIGLGQFEAALPELNLLLQNPQAAPAALQNIGLCHYLLANFSAALPPLKTLYDNGARSADLLRLLISTLHHLGDVSAALPIADGATDYANNDEALAGIMGLLYLDANQPQKAARWSARSLVKNPNSLDSLVVQGTLRAGAFDFAVARQQFDQALSIAPSAGRAWIGLSLISMANNDFNNAKREAEKACHYMPTHIGSWHVLAWIQLIQGQLDEAQSTFEHALSLNRNFAESHGGLAAIAALRGQRAAAEKLIEVAERLDPKCLSAKFARSTLQKGRGDAQLARETLISALSGLSPRDDGTVSRIIEEMSKKQ